MIGHHLVHITALIEREVLNVEHQLSIENATIFQRCSG
jgi:hypothetical protein